MNVGAYILQRLALLIPVLLGLTILTFLLTTVVPGDPARLAAGPQANAEQVEKIRQEYGLDDPIYVQYINYMRGVLTGEWGRSILSRRPVTSDLRIYWPATAELVIAALAIAVVTGIPLGIISAVKQNRWQDHSSRVVALIGVSLPAFWLALLLQWFVALRFGVLPIGGRINVQVGAPEHVTGMYILDSILTGNFAAFTSALLHIALPALTLSTGALATITRMTRSSMLEVLGHDYIRTARAKGLAERPVLMRHALRNAIMPTITMVGLSFGWLMGGSVLIETIFDWPGIGLYAVNSAMTLDFMPIMGIAIIYGVVFSLINLAVDVLYGFIDPRIRFG
jgi:peptide/nickel transport system permease protein